MRPEAYREMAATEDRHWWFAARRAILSEVLKSLKLPRNARILEVGCGTGGNLRMLEHFGAVSALEMDDSARVAAVAKTNSHADIRAGSCPHHIPFKDERFDLICLFDVLEHIEEDQATLAALRGLLAPDGRILVTVPAYPWMWSAHDDHLHHKRRYTARALQQIVEKADLNVEKLSYFNSLLFPLIAAARLKDKWLASHASTGAGIPPRPLNGALKQLFGLERWVLPRLDLPFGASLLCVLEASPRSL